MRFIMVTTLAISLFMPNAMAADNAGSLPPGKPAGVQKAQDAPAIPFWWVYAGVAAGAILVGITNDGCNTCNLNSTPATTAT
jgi:hypothetical protein